MILCQKLNNLSMTFIITRSSIADTHEAIIEHISKHGEIIPTESGELTKEIRDVKIKITSPLEPKRISPK